MVTVPTAIPEIEPLVGSTVAIEGSLLLHVPPSTVPYIVVVDPVDKLPLIYIVPGSVVPDTINVVVATLGLHAPPVDV